MIVNVHVFKLEILFRKLYFFGENLMKQVLLSGVLVSLMMLAGCAQCNKTAACHDQMTSQPVAAADHHHHHDYKGEQG